MATLDQIEALLKDVNARLAAQPETVTEERVNAIVASVLESRLAEDGEFVRKLRFAEPAPQLIGSKFARHNYGLADIEFLYDLQLSAQRAGKSSGPTADLENAFKAMSKAVLLSDDEVKRIDRQAIDNLFPRVTRTNKAAYEAALKAMDSAESGYGSQLIGAQYVGDLWEGARPMSRIFSLLSSFEMTAPTAYLPVEADLPEMLYVTENTSASASDYATTKTGSNRVQVDARKFIFNQMWSGELEEDSIIPFIPFLRRQLAKALAIYADSVILNGDTTNAGTGNINLDDADPADTKHYLAFDGIRHASLVDNTNNRLDVAGALTYSQLRNNTRMIDRTYDMDWGHPDNPADLVYVSDPETADWIARNMDEFITVDKFGKDATVLTGQIGRVGQHPYLTHIRSSLTEADGKVSTTAANNVKGQITKFNKGGLVVGWRRRLQVEVERLPRRDQTGLIYSLRLGLGRFSPTGSASGIEWTDVLYNLTLS